MGFATPVLAVLVSPGGQIEIHSFPDVNAGAWRIPATDASFPVWSKSSNELFFSSPAGLWAVAYQTDPTFQAAAPQRLFPLQSSYQRNYDVSNDGQRFLFIKNPPERTIEDAGGQELVVVLNWTEELKRLVPTE